MEPSSLCIDFSKLSKYSLTTSGETDARTFLIFWQVRCVKSPECRLRNDWALGWEIVLEALYFPDCSVEVSLGNKTHIQCTEWKTLTVLICVNSEASSTAEKTVGCPGLFPWIPRRRWMLNITLAFLSDIFPICIRRTALWTDSVECVL